MHKKRHTQIFSFTRRRPDAQGGLLASPGERSSFPWCSLGPRFLLAALVVYVVVKFGLVQVYLVRFGKWLVVLGLSPGWKSCRWPSTPTSAPHWRFYHLRTVFKIGAAGFAMQVRLEPCFFPWLRKRLRPHSEVVRATPGQECVLGLTSSETTGRSHDNNRLQALFLC